MTLINMDALQIALPGTHRTITKNLDFAQTFGTQDIDLTQYDERTRKELTHFAATGSHAPAEPQINVKELEAEQQRDIQSKADQTRAINRLEEYVKVGLENTEANAAIIKEYVNNNAAGYWNFEVVEAAVKDPRLTWRKEEPAPAVSEPVEVLLSDGTKPLPLDVENHILRNASKAQAKDYLKRIDASKKLHQHGRFGSKFL
jgi:hypothetical protein